MPLLSTLGNASIQSYGTAGIQPGGSALFSGSQRALSVAPSANFAYGLGDFTVEMWVRPTDYNSWRVLWAQTGGYNSRAYWYFLFYLDRFSGQLAIQMNPFYTLHPTAVALNVWSHVAVVRRSNIVTLYVNGVGASSFFGNSNLTDQTVRPTVGNYSILYQAAGQDYQGYLTNVRVAKSAIYNGNFTPSRTPFTRTSQGATNVQLLLNHRTSGTLATDSSANNLSVLNTNVTFSTLSPYTEPFVSTTPPVLISATVTPDSTAVTEGTTITFSVASTNAVNGTYYYTIEETAGPSSSLTTADFTLGALSGTFTITGNSGSFPLTVTRDLITEGDESFSVFVRSGSITGPVLGVSPIIDITDSSLTPVFTVTPASINEGGSGTFTVANVGPDGTYFWVMFNNTSSNSDFSAASGSFLVSGSTGGIDNGTGSFSVTAIKELLTEGSENFQVQVRSGSTSGPAVVTSNFVTIVDVSLTPSVTPASNNMSEGQSLSFTAANLGPNGTYFWSINHGTTAAADFSAENGSFSITGGGAQDNGTGTFSVTALNDFVTEGSQSFTVSVRSGSISGPILATTSSVIINDTSTTVTASGLPSSVSEGSNMTISVSAGSFPNGTYFWTILNGTTTNADFTAASGSFTVSNGVSGSFTVTPATLDGAEGTEFFQVQIRTGSTSGPVIATTGSLTLNLSAT
jgi:hypothetical protein